MSVFETEACGRCGGGGSYSYCQMYGSTCFKCGGSGKVFTKRGLAAWNFFIESQKKPLSEVKPGMFFWDDLYGKKAKWLPILSIEENGSYSEWNGVRSYITYIETKRCKTGVYADSMVRAIRDEAERQQLLAAALEHQGKLGKNGKLLKKFEQPVAA